MKRFIAITVISSFIVVGLVNGGQVLPVDAIPDTGMVSTASNPFGAGASNMVEIYSNTTSSQDIQVAGTRCIDCPCGGSCCDGNHPCCGPVECISTEVRCGCRVQCDVKCMFP